MPVRGVSVPLPFYLLALILIAVGIGAVNLRKWGVAFALLLCCSQLYFVVTMAKHYGCSREFLSSSAVIIFTAAVPGAACLLAWKDLK